MNTKRKLLDYCLTDVLEMHYQGDKKTLSHLKDELLSRPIKNHNLYAPPTFALEDALIVIQNGDFKKINEVFFLKTHPESFEAFKIRKVKRHF